MFLDGAKNDQDWTSNVQSEREGRVGPPDLWWRRMVEDYLGRDVL